MNIRAFVDNYFPMLLEDGDEETIRSIQRSIESTFRVYDDAVDRKIIMNIASIAYLAGRDVGLTRGVRLSGEQYTYYEEVIEGMIINANL